MQWRVMVTPLLVARTMTKSAEEKGILSIPYFWEAKYFLEKSWLIAIQLSVAEIVSPAWKRWSCCLAYLVTLLPVDREGAALPQEPLRQPATSEPHWFCQQEAVG